MKNLLKTFVALTLLNCSFAIADSIIMGEYQGHLDGSVIYSIPKSRVDQRNISCKSALDIDLSATDLSIPYSNFECNDEIFNDGVHSYKIVGTSIYPKNTDNSANLENGSVGTIESDGTINIHLNTKSVRTFEVNAARPFCGFYKGVNKIDYVLNHTFNLKLKKLDEKSYFVQREYASETTFLALQTLDRNDCASVRDALDRASIIGSTARFISGIVSK